MEVGFWRGKRVFLTGHTGYKGSWLALWLQHLQAEVTGYSLDPPTQPNLFESAHVKNHMTDGRGDVRDLSPLTDALIATQPDVVFHLAAQPLVRDSYRIPVETYATNVMGTVNLLEACRQSPSVRSVVIVTSDKCYENREWPWGYRESDPLGGSDPYSGSKGCAELAVASYRRSFLADAAIGVASVRAGNVIGGGDWAEDRLIPDIIRGLDQHGEFLVRNPSAVRPWQLVLEPLRGYLMLAECLHSDPLKWSGGWNFGPRQEDAQPVSVIADNMVALWGSGHWINGQETNAVHEAHLLQLDCNKARRLLHWQPACGLQDALRFTVEWYKAACGGNVDLKSLSLEQISQYTETCKQAMLPNHDIFPADRVA